MKAIEKYQTDEDLDKLYNKRDLVDPKIIAALKILNNLLINDKYSIFSLILTIRYYFHFQRDIKWCTY
jgi:hypothetical protein